MVLIYSHPLPEVCHAAITRCPGLPVSLKRLLRTPIHRLFSRVVHRPERITHSDGSHTEVLSPPCAPKKVDTIDRHKTSLTPT